MWKRKNCKRTVYGLAMTILFGLTCQAMGETAIKEYPLEVFPREDKAMIDEETGTSLLFLTTGPSKDTNLYFHQRSWLSDSSMILFMSNREAGGLMGYLVETGEIVQLKGSDGAKLNCATAAREGRRVFAMAGERCVELTITPEIVAGQPTRVIAKERTLGVIPKVDTYLNESCDGKYLATGGSDIGGIPGKGIVLIHVKEGGFERLCGMPEGVTYQVHVQWSRTNPVWLSFAGDPLRLWIVDIRDRKPWCPYRYWPGELVTHESWWVNDQMLFCGGIHPKPTEDSHIKVLNIRTGEVRIIGEGCWWPGATSEQLAKRNWWHASGSEDGRWVAGDNWHGDIMLFDGKTSRPHLLTTAHRTYGKGTHPEVGWDRRGEQVIFGSEKIPGAHVCVATIPAKWQEEVDAIGQRIEAAPKQ